jgi:pimeloyl-ACP methyl ester carboxylesterase
LIRTIAAVGFIGLVLGVSPTGIPGDTGQSASPVIKWEPYPVQTSSGSQTFEIGRFGVPERHARPDGKSIEIAVVRLKSLAKSPKSPVVYLDGGPGGSGVSILSIPSYTRLIAKLREQRDVLLLVQRGTALARPRLSCPSAGPLPADFLTSAERMMELSLPRYQKCAESFRTAGHDLAAYNTDESAADIEALQRAIGAERVSLLGFSYGTHLGLAAIRRHRAGLDRVVLAGTEGPDHTWKLPSTYDDQLQRIADLAKADAGAGMPDFVGTLKQLVAKLKQQPVTVEIGDGAARRSVQVGDGGLLALLRRDIGDTNDTSWIPALVYDTLAGRLDALRSIVTRRWPQYEGGIQMMAAAMDCSSAASAARRSRIQSETPASVFGSLVNAPYPEVCQAIGVPPLPDSYRQPIVTDVPTLFVSGTLDSNTRPAQADDVRASFSRSWHLIVENAGHESTLPEPAVQDAIVEFLAGADGKDRKITIAAPKLRRPGGEI